MRMSCIQVLGYLLEGSIRIASVIPRQLCDPGKEASYVIPGSYNNCDCESEECSGVLSDKLTEV